MYINQSRITLIIISMAIVFSACSSSEDDSDDATSTNIFFIRNNYDEPIILKSILNSDALDLSTDQRIDTIAAETLSVMMTLSFYEDRGLEISEVFDSLQVTSLDEEAFVITNQVDTLDWATEVSVSESINSTTYRNTLTWE